jgi:hypothetical protein
MQQTARHKGKMLLYAWLFVLFLAVSFPLFVVISEWTGLIFSLFEVLVEDTRVVIACSDHKKMMQKFRKVR